MNKILLLSLMISLISCGGDETTTSSSSSSTTTIASIDKAVGSMNIFKTSASKVDDLYFLNEDIF